MELDIVLMENPTPRIASALTRWESDPALMPYSRPNQSQEDVDRAEEITLEVLRERGVHQKIYLIYLSKQLVGEVSYQIDPAHLFKKETGTAWVGIVLGEACARGKGIGRLAMTFLEKEISRNGLKRIELGVFEFNETAIQLYSRLGYTEIGRIDGFTYWQGRMWQDIRMEKYLS
jgi:RimJ/RimL family protein N-acetyltransferase